MLDKAQISQGDIATIMQEMGQKAAAAAAVLATTTSDRKHAALIGAAEALRKNVTSILDANAIDMENGRETGLSKAMLDRLNLTEDRVMDMANAVCAIAELTDPVGQVMSSWDRPNGLNISRVRTPLGVIGVIYESRPNVTADAGSLCLQAGNAVILRGGSDSFNSSR